MVDKKLVIGGVCLIFILILSCVSSSGGAYYVTVVEPAAVEAAAVEAEAAAAVEAEAAEAETAAAEAETAAAETAAAEAAAWKLSANLVKVGFICNTIMALDELDGSPIDITDIFKGMLEAVEDANDIQASDTQRYICDQAAINELDLVAGYTNFACSNGGSYPGSRKFFNDLDARIYDKYVEATNKPDHVNDITQSPCGVPDCTPEPGVTSCGMFHGYIIRYTDEADAPKTAFVKWGAEIDLSNDFNDSANAYVWSEDALAWLDG